MSQLSDKVNLLSEKINNLDDNIKQMINDMVDTKLSRVPNSAKKTLVEPTYIPAGKIGRQIIRSRPHVDNILPTDQITPSKIYYVHKDSEDMMSNGKEYELLSIADDFEPGTYEISTFLRLKADMKGGVKMWIGGFELCPVTDIFVVDERFIYSGILKMVKVIDGQNRISLGVTGMSGSRIALWGMILKMKKINTE